MLKKRPIVAILTTIEQSNVQVHNTGGKWAILKTVASAKALLGPFDTGKIKRIITTAPAAEKTQVVLIGASTTKETIVASTRYRIEIGNPDQDYETKRTGPAVHAYTSAAVLSGTAATDRATVYTALVNKINAYGGNNATAYALSYVAFTGGTSSDDSATNFIIGETVTQETSSITAKVAKCTITDGAMASNNAVGHLWLYDISAVASWDAGTKTWTAAGTVAGVSTNCVVTGTAASQIHNTGIAVVDNAGYFTSHINRGGVNYVAVTAGFSIDVPEVTRAAVYAQGIGSVMKSLMPVYDLSKQNVLRGKLEFDFQDGMEPDATKTYNEYIIVMEDGPDDVSGVKETAEKQVVLYADAAATYISDFDTAVNALT